MRNRISNIKDKTWEIITTTQYANRAHPIFIGVSTAVGAISGCVFGVVAAILSYDYEGLNESERRALKVETIENLAATFSCKVTKIGKGNDGQLPRDLRDVRFKCVNMTLSERVLQMATNVFDQINEENNDFIPCLKAATSSFVFGLGGFLLGGYTGYRAATILVNIKLELSGQGITPADVRNKKQERHLSATMKRYHLDNKEQAQALLAHPELHIWFLQGIQKIKDGSIPLYIFMFIASYIGELSDKNTCSLFRKYHNEMPLRLFALSHIHDAKSLLVEHAYSYSSEIERAGSVLSLSIFSRPDREKQIELKLDNFENKKQETQKRFEKRMNFNMDESDTTKQNQTSNKQRKVRKRRN